MIFRLGSKPSFKLEVETARLGVWEQLGTSGVRPRSLRTGWRPLLDCRRGLGARAWPFHCGQETNPHFPDAPLGGLWSPKPRVTETRVTVSKSLHWQTQRDCCRLLLSGGS